MNKNKNKNMTNSSFKLSCGVENFLMIGTLFLLIAALSACGTFAGSSDNSNGSQGIDFQASIASFNAESGNTLYHNFPVNNYTTKPLTIKRVVFENNLCNAFSLFNVLNEEGRFVSPTADNYVVPSNTGIQLQVKFQPTACSLNSYETVMRVYYENESNVNETFAFTLRSEGIPPESGQSEDCSQFVQPEVQACEIYGSPSPGDYFITVTNMRAFLFPTGSDTNKLIIGTDIGNIDPDAYIPPHLPITISQANNGKSFTIERVSQCINFLIPSDPSDTYFTGSDTRLTTPELAEGGRIVETAPDLLGDRRQKVDFQLEDFEVSLRADGIEETSLIVEPGVGTFRTNIVIDFTTKQTSYNEHLDKIFLTPPMDGLNEAEQRELFNLVQNDDGDYLLEGSPLNGGEITLVGIGTFKNPDATPFIGSNLGKQFLIEQDAYIFIQLEARLSVENGDPNNLCDSEAGGEEAN